MLSALILSEHSYPAIAPGGTTGTPAVRPSQSSRTRDSFPSNIQRLQQIETDILLLHLLSEIYNLFLIQEVTLHFCKVLTVAREIGLYLYLF